MIPGGFFGCISKYRNSPALFAIFLLPLYLIGIGIWKYHDCSVENNTLNISLCLIVIGVLVFIAALNVPARRYAMADAFAVRERRQRLEIPNPQFPEELTEKEIQYHIPCHLNRISHVGCFALCGVLQALAYYTFRMDSAASCAPIIYWTATFLSVVYCVFMMVLILSCCSYCWVSLFPLCLEKCRRRRRSEEV